MASRSIDLGGLPPIQQAGGFDIDALVKIATLMQNQHEMQLKDMEAKSKFGTPSTPSAFSSTPARGLTAVPSAGDAPQPMMPGLDAAGNPIDPLLGGTGAAPLIYAKAGTSGTPGSTELATKAGISNLLTPESAETMMNQRGYEGITFAKGKKLPAFYNPDTGQIKDATQMAGEDAVTFRPTDMNTAIKEAGDFYRAKINASGQGLGDILRLYSELLRVKPWDRTEGDKATLRVLKTVVPEKLGVGAAVKMEKDAMDKFKAEYKADKSNAMQAINIIRTQPLSSSEKRDKIRTVIDRLKSAHDDEEGFYDLTTAQEKTLINGD